MQCVNGGWAASGSACTSLARPLAGASLKKKTQCPSRAEVRPPGPHLHLLECVDEIDPCLLGTLTHEHAVVNTSRAKLDVV